MKEKQIKTNIKQWIVTLLFVLAAPLPLSAQVEITNVPEHKSLQEMVDYAKTLQRRPYRLGGNGPYAFDCSGFTKYCFKKVGVDLDRTSADQGKQGKKIRKRKHLKTGDLVCFNGSKIGRKVGHVGIVVENDGGEFSFIHASSSVGITISRSNVKYYDDRYVAGRRITTDKKIRRAIKKFAQAKKDSIALANGQPVKEPTISKEEIEERKAKSRERKNNEKLKKAQQDSVAKANANKQKDKKTSTTENKKKDTKKAEKKNDSPKAVKDTIKDTTVVPTPPVDSTAVRKDSTKNAPSGTNVVKTLTGPYHTVVKGDTLYNIAKRAGCTVQQLIKWNNLKDNTLSIGQVIRIWED